MSLWSELKLQDVAWSPDSAIFFVTLDMSLSLRSLSWDRSGWTCDKANYGIDVVGTWMLAVKFFQLLCIFVNFHNKILEVGENERASQTAS